MLAIRTEGLCKDYRVGFWRRRSRVLHSLDLAVEEGESFGYLGPNGAGKTTTIRMLATLLQPTSGTARVMGRDIVDDPNGVRRLIGFMPERPGFYEEMRARAILRFYGSFYRIPRERLDARISELSTLVGLDRFIDSRVKGYSHGMRKRLAIAAALVHEPRILILDEPSTGLDPKGVMEFREMLRGLRDEGYTIFLSSHVLPEIQLLCNRVGILRRGRLVAEDSIDVLTERLKARTKLRLTVHAAGVTDELLAAVRGVPGVVSADRAGFGMMVLGEPSPDVPAEVNATLVRGGARVTTMFAQEPTLEDVFLDVTGGEGGV
jgi:ABC-2 type transport system ATP-binding protein